MPRSLVCALWAMSVLAGPLSAQPTDPPATVRIGNWNIEWLGTATRRDQKTPQEAKDVAQYIIDSKVDLLGLNEITGDGEAEGQLTNKTLTDALAVIKEKTGQTWKYVLFPKEDAAEKELLVGVAWNTARATPVGKPFRIPVRRPLDEKTAKHIWDRHPHGAKFSFGEGKTDVVVISLHMKSNVARENEDTVQLRLTEARTLTRALGELRNHFKDDDVVLVGDLNTKAKDEPALQAYRWGAGLRDLNDRDRYTWIKSTPETPATRRYPAAPFDRILVPEEQPEFDESTLTVVRKNHLGSEEEFRKKLSDHYMVVAEIRVMADDD